MGLNRLWIAPMLRSNIRGNVRRQLAGVWVRGPLPVGGCILAPNHHSWWDGYVLAELAWQQQQPIVIMMTERQLSRFPFLSLIGAMSTRELRPVVRAAQEGAWAVIFPEGAIHPQGGVGAIQSGAAWLSRAAGMPLIPVAVRVVMRGAERPEAFVRFGEPVASGDLPAALNALLAELDADLRVSDPDHPPAGYLRWVGGKASTHDEISWPSRMLTRLAGFQVPEGER